MNYKVSSGLFSINLECKPQSTVCFSMEIAIETIREYFIKKYSLVCHPVIKLADGELYILTASADSPNTSLIISLRSYLGKARLITINLEGSGSMNTDSLSCDNEVEAKNKEKFGINNTSMELIKQDLNGLFETDVERIPVLKRGCSVPVYFPSSDERVLEYDFNKILVNENSKFQNIKILSSPTLGNSLLLDDLQNLAEVDINYTHGLMNFGEINYKNKEILILGGGDGGLLHELLKEQPKHVTMIDIDGVVIEKCKIHLRNVCGSTLDNLISENYEIIIDDCLKYLDKYSNENKKFDYIFNDLTDIPLNNDKTEAGWDLWNFIKIILNKSFKCLKEDGKYLNHAVGIGCTKALKSYEKVLNELELKVKFSRSSKWVPSFLEEWVFYQISLEKN